MYPQYTINQAYSQFQPQPQPQPQPQIYSQFQSQPQTYLQPHRQSYSQFESQSDFQTQTQPRYYDEPQYAQNDIDNYNRFKEEKPKEIFEYTVSGNDLNINDIRNTLYQYEMNNIITQKTPYSNTIIITVKIENPTPEQVKIIRQVLNIRSLDLELPNIFPIFPSFPMLSIFNMPLLLDFIPMSFQQLPTRSIPRSNVQITEISDDEAKALTSK